MGNQKNDAGNSEMSKLIAMLPKIKNNLNSIITSSAKSSIAFAEAKKMEEARLLAKMIISQLKNNSDLSEKTITISPNQDGTDTQLYSLLSWLTTKQEEYNSTKKDIMEGKRDKELGIATLKLERQKHKTEYENLSKIENKSDYRMYEEQFNKTLFELTDSIITELEKWQTYLNEGKTEIERIPEWVKKLIDDCIIDIDGKTVITNNLDKVAIAIGEQGKSVTKEILKRFIKKDGNPYSSSSLTQALCAVNLGNSSKKTTKKL